MKKQSRYLSYLMWGCAVSYYLFQYILRVSPSVMMDEIMGAFNVSAHGFAILSATAMYCYSFAQIPAGIMTDVFGAKRVILFSTLLCITGIGLFATAHNLPQAFCGRALLGFGSAAAFLTVNKIGADWFPPGRRAFVFAMTMTAGTIGALNGGAPLSALAHSLGWREALLALVALGFGIFLLNLFVLKATPAHKDEVRAKVTVKQVWTQVRSALGNRQVLILAIAAVGIYLPISILADLWGVAFLMQFYGITKTTAAQCTCLMYIGLCVGALVISWWSDKIQRRKRLIIACLLGMISALLSFLYASHLPLAGACGLLFFMGFCTGGEMVCFANATEIVPHRMMGTVIGFVNGIVTLGGAFIQQQVGRILDEVWCGQCTAEGLRFYTVSEYRQALTVSVLVVTVTCFIALLLKEKKTS